jgi:hypothetical protein
MLTIQSPFHLITTYSFTAVLFIIVSEYIRSLLVMMMVVRLLNWVLIITHWLSTLVNSSLILRVIVFINSFRWHECLSIVYRSTWRVCRFTVLIKLTACSIISILLPPLLNQLIILNNRRCWLKGVIRIYIRIIHHGSLLVMPHCFILLKRWDIRVLLDL